MNEGQKTFFDFIMDHVQNGKEEEAKTLLTESFGKQADGTFGPEYLKNFMPRLLAIIKHEKMEEVKNIMTKFGGPPVKK